MIYLDYEDSASIGAGGWDTSINNSGTIVFTDSDRTATFAVGGFGVTGCRSIIGHVSGKKYAEVAYNFNAAFPSNVRNTVGVTVSSMVSGDVGDDNANEVGVRSYRYVYQLTSSLGELDLAGTNPGIMRIAYNAGTGELWLAINGGDWGGGSFSVGDPETGSDPIVTLPDPSITHYLFANFESSFLPLHVVTLVEHEEDMTYPIPAGFTSWATL